MSEHDPFDGNYDDAPAGAAADAAQPAAAGTPETEVSPQASTADTSAVVEPPAPAVEVSVYTRSQLERMRKAELQAVARERSLNPAGDRDDLIERIEAAQGANA